MNKDSDFCFPDQRIQSAADILSLKRQPFALSNISFNCYKIACYAPRVCNRKYFEFKKNFLTAFCVIQKLTTKTGAAF